MRNKFYKICLVSLCNISTLAAVAQTELPPDNGNYHSSLELQEMFLEGLLLLAFFVNVLFYRTTRDKTHLYFALMLIFLAVQRSVTTLGSYLHWRYPDVWEYLSYSILSWAFTIFFLIRFISQVFKLKDDSPFWNKFLLVLGLLYGGMLFLFQFVQNGFFSTPGSVISLVWVGMQSVICISILILFFKQISRNKKYSKLIIIGGIPLLLVWSFYSFAGQYIIYSTNNIDDFQKIPWWFFTYRIIETVCIAWFVLLFLWTLILKFKQIIKENAQRAINYERLEKEKEIERRQLVDGLNIRLEKTVDERTADLRNSLSELRTTQKQLIQSEKMASLGELTAEIAHEIQNPLNFVNNFSEVNRELLDEMISELSTDNKAEAITIAGTLKQNLEKILHHGKQADGIVKSMLQHSRSSSARKEKTDINRLAVEYLRLAYHGLKANDKSFNATLKTHYEEGIGTLNIIPQDIGRAFMNLVLNAFYAVNEKKKFESNGYEPIVSVTTRKNGGKVLISVKDNGNGISQTVLDKIFQPFFTTKPTGQGTGLGLSLSYDIVKAHGGELKVETTEGQGAEFIIELPRYSG